MRAADEPEAEPEAGASEPEAGASYAQASALACAALGARVATLELGGDVDEDRTDASLRAALEELGGALSMLVVDAHGLLEAAAAGGAGGADPERQDAIPDAPATAALRSCMAHAWDATRAAANVAFLPAGAGGRIVYLAPAPDLGARGEGSHAAGARAGLENLARTLSIEWARHAIRLVSIAPGGAGGAREAAALTAYLASPAGAYFSGCVLELGGA